MDRTRRLLPLVLLLALPMGLASDADCAPRSSFALGTGETAAGEFYVVPGFLNPFGEDSLYVYQESNGMPGLQRHDDWRDDTCGGRFPSDTLIL